MSLVRTTALRDALTNAQTSGVDVAGTAYDLGGVASTEKLYGALHHTCALTTDALEVKVQSATSSGFTAAVDRITFATRGSIGAEWATPTTMSSEPTFWRAIWSVSSGGSHKFLALMGIK